VSEPESGVASGSEQLPALPPAESPVLERERTNIREKEERRIRGSPPEVTEDEAAEPPLFLVSSDEFLEPKQTDGQ
jgi:hypothetical protein